MLSLALTLALAPQQDFVGPVWEELGPAPLSGSQFTGRVTSIATSTSNANRYYVAGADGGVWRSDNAGADWTPLTDHMPTLAIGALVVDPTDHDVVYAGTGEANYANHSRYGLGLYKTTDGGATWQHLAEDTFGGRTFAKLVIDPSDTQMLYAAIGRAGGFPELAAAKGHPDATGERGVFKSSDGGVSWTRLTGLPNLAATDIALDPVNPNRLYAAIGRIFGSSQNGVYRSDNAGSSWVKLGGGLPTSTFGRVSIATAPSQANRIYALVTDDATSTGGSADTLGAYRSDNAGVSWTSLPISSSLQSSYGWYLSVVTVDPANADRVFMGGLTFRRSDNAGSSWSTITPPHVDLHAAAWDAAGRLIVGDDGGVHRTTNNGGSWSSLNDGLGLVQLYAGLSTHPTDAETFFGGFQDNGSARRTTTGTGWTSVFGGDGGWTQIDQASPSRVFVEYQGTGNLFRSTNGGNSFSDVGSGISGRNCFLPPFLIDPSDSNRMLYASHQVYRSTNGGSSWSAISGDLTTGTGAIRTLAQSRTNPDVVYAATNDGNVLRSDNGGSNWTLLLSGQPGWPRVTRELTVHPKQPMKVFLAGASHGIDQVRRSGNGGQTWKSLDGDLPDVPVNVIGVHDDGDSEHVFAGSDQGLFYSRGDGKWVRYGRGLPHAVVIDVAIDVARNRIVVATQGRGAWRAPLLLPKAAR